MLTAFLLTAGAVALGQLAPGPNLLAVASASLAEGRRVGFALAVGVAVGVFFWVAVAASGVLALALVPGALTLMKFLAGGYLVFLAVRAIRKARDAGNLVLGEAPAISVRQAFWRGVLVNITNPKSALMWSAVATFLLGSGLSGWQVLAFAPIGAGTALCVYGVYALAFSAPAARRLYARGARLFQSLFGVAFGALGAALLVDGARDLARRTA